MPVAVKGTGGGSVTLTAGAAATDTTLTLPNTTGTVALIASPTFSGTLTATTITSPASTALTIQSAGTTAMTVSTSQNVGIGTTTPAQKLQIVSNSGGYAFQITGSVNDYYGMSLYNTSGGANARSYLQFGNDTDQYQAFISLNSSGNAAQGGAKSFNIFQGTNAPITFSISGGEKMRLDSNGYLLVGATSSAGVYNLQVEGGAGPQLSLRNSQASAGKIWRLGPDSSGNNMVVYNQSNLGCYIVDGASTWSSSSDERVKDIIEPIADGLAKVSSLRAIIGSYKSDENKKRRPFLIAQDVQAVLPEAVDASNPDNLGLAYTDLIPLLVAAVQELTDRLAALEAK
jgi:hypothetical protein